MAHTKAKGSTKLGRDSQSKRLGVKIYGGQAVRAGNVIIRQRGTAYRPGPNVVIGKDHTLMAKIDGTVQFSRSSRIKFTGLETSARIVSVLPHIHTSVKEK